MASRAKQEQPDLSYIHPALRALAVRTDSLLEDPQNARKHNDRNIRELAGSLEANGQVKPVVVQGNIVRAGNGTLRAVRLLGRAWIAALPLEAKSKDEGRAFGIADNRTAELATWDENILGGVFFDLEPDLQKLTGFTEAEVRALMSPDDERDDSDEDALEGPPKEPVTRRGELIHLGDHRLLCGDAMSSPEWDVLMQHRQADMVFTDPPYGVDYESSSGKYAKISGDERTQDSLLELLVPSFQNAARRASETAGWYIWHASMTRDEFAFALKAAGLQERQYIIWAKQSIVLGRADYQWSHEPCFYASRSEKSPAFYGDRAQQTVWRVSYRRGQIQASVIGPGVMVSDGKGAQIYVTRVQPRAKKRVRLLRLEEGQTAVLDPEQGRGTLWEVARDVSPEHPTQKPVELARRAILNSSKPGESVLDFFSGSGSTLLAAEKTGRVFYGMELDPSYCDVAVNRWEHHTGRSVRRSGP